jgi:hypothetical protein
MLQRRPQSKPTKSAKRQILPEWPF